MNVHEKIDRLKNRIASGGTVTKDIDMLNEIDTYIREMEEKAKALPEPALLESFDEMVPGNVVIQNATIYVGQPPHCAK